MNWIVRSPRPLAPLRLSLLSLLFTHALLQAADPVKVSDYTFEPPSAWEAVTTRSPMRAAQFKATHEGKSAEIVFFFFGAGGAGGTQANIDRWLSQFQEPKGQLKSRTEQIKAGKHIATLVYAEGTYLSGPPGGQRTPEPGSKMVAAILEGAPSGPVFVKMTGPKAVVEATEGALKKMVEAALK